MGVGFAIAITGFGRSADSVSTWTGKGGFYSEGVDEFVFPQTDKLHYFPEFEFWICEIWKGSNHVIKGPAVSLMAKIELDCAI